MTFQRDACAITGIGTTEFSRDSGRSVLTLATEASSVAIADAGLTAADIDGIIRCDFDVVTAHDLANALGIPNLTYWSAHGPGGSAPCSMIASAVGAVVSGQASNVLVFRSLNGRSGFRLGRGRNQFDEGRVGGNGTYEEFFVPYGSVSPGQVWAMLARRHMFEYGTTMDHLGRIAVTIRERANANPNAQLGHKKLTMSDYLSAPMVSAPLRLYDYCLESDGASAIVVSAADRAIDCPEPPVLITGVAMGGVPGPQGGMVAPTLLREDPLFMPSANIAKTLYTRAGIGPSEIDVAQLYDCFTITVLVQLEDYGFCGRGEGGPFVASGAIDVDGTLPINTAGGNLSEGYIHGMTHVLEGVRQMRGTSTSPVHAETCLVTSGIPIISSAMILRRG